MFPTINAEYRAAKRADADNSLILESVLDVDETLPGSDEEMESIVDPDSVPDDVYAKIDKELDKIVEDPSYDDTEAEEMLDDDFDADDISDAEIDAIMDEAVAMMERKDKIAGVFANLSEKAGNNMGNSTGMGLLKTLSESVNQFQGGKMSDPIGKAYEPVETPDESIDETKLENEALKESAVEAALARFHSLMEASNPDVEDFPGKEGTTQADGDTPAGMPEPNGDEDGNNVGGDDQVVDQEAKEVGVEDGGSDAIDVIKANEAVSRYMAVAEAVTNPDVEDFPNQTGAGNDHGEKEGALPDGQEPADFPNSTGDKKVNSGDVPTNRYKAVAEAAVIDSLDESIKSNAKDFARGVKAGYIEHAKQTGPLDTSAKGALANAGEKAAIGAAIGAIKGASAVSKLKKAGASEEEIEAAKKDIGKHALRGAASGAVFGAVANQTLARAYNKAANEAVTNPDVEDFPKAEGTHSAEGNGVPAGMSHEDDSVQPAYTDQSDFEQNEVGVEDGGTDAIDVIKTNESVSRYRAIAESAKTDKIKADLEKFEEENPNASKIEKLKAGARAAMGKCPKCGKNPCECEC